jgi:hypothetical protein
MYDFDDIKITKREVIVSISIIAVMLMIGLWISSTITQSCEESNEKYYKAVKITDQDLFSYGMRTNVGNAFVYGDLKAVDPVTYPEIGGEYMYVKKIKEEYTRHTRVVTKTRTVNGKTQTYTTTETYWTWDEVDRDSISCDTVTFLGEEFDIDKIDIPGSHHIETIYKWSDVRYVYHAIDAHYTGTIFTDLRDGTISDDTPFYKDADIPQTLEHLEQSGTGWVILFWVLWVLLTGALTYGFYYLDNKWLE